MVLVIGILGASSPFFKCQICPSCCTYTALVVALAALCSFSLPLSAPFSRGVISGLSRECLPRMSQNQVTRAAAAGAGLKIVAFLFFLGVIGNFFSVAKTPEAWYHGGVVMAGVMAVIRAFCGFSRRPCARPV